MNAPPVKKNIALILSKLQMGGLEKVVLQLAESFGEMGHQVDIFFFDPVMTLPIPPNIHRGLHLIRLNKKFKRSLWYCQYQVKKALKTQERLHQRPYDLILGHLIQESAYLHTLPQDRCFYVIHGNLSYWIEGLKARSPQYAQRKLRKLQQAFHGRQLITVSEGVQDDVLEILKLQPLSTQTIYNPFPISKIRTLAKNTIPHQNPYPSAPYVIYVSRFDPENKNPSMLLQAFQKVPAPYRLLLLTEDSEALRDLIQSIDQTGRIDIIGFQENPYPFIQQAKLCLLSSNSEGFGNVIIESLIVGTPVVSTDCNSGPREIMVGNLAHWLTPVGNVDLFAEKILEALHTQIDILEDNIQRFEAHWIAEQYLNLAK